MSLARYFVVRVGGRWHVTLEGTSMASHSTRDEAVASAIVMADLMGAMHHDADVMLEIARGSPLELVWSYGRDAVPAGAVQVKDRQTSGALSDAQQVQQGEAA